MTVTSPRRLLRRFARTKVELWGMMREFWGIDIPTFQVCDDHTAPMDAIWEAYNAEEPVVVWHASRGLAGKTYGLAALAATELVTFSRCRASLLGGSLFQSQLAHEYMQEAGDFETPPGFAPARRAPT